VKWTHDLAYRRFTGLEAARAAGEWTLHAPGGHAMAAALENLRLRVAIDHHE
jgi:hypothetical protein